ncbi:unnamed protein product [Brassica oleracea var. botrytis]
METRWRKFEELYMFSCGIFTKLSSVIRGCLVLTISSDCSPSLRSFEGATRFSAKR